MSTDHMPAYPSPCPRGILSVAVDGRFLIIAIRDDKPTHITLNYTPLGHSQSGVALGIGLLGIKPELNG